MKKILSFCFLVSLLYNATAQPIFQKSYYVDTNAITQGASFVILSDGDYLCVGRTGTSQIYDVFLMRTDSLGNTKWAKTLATPYQDWVTLISQVDDSNFIIDGAHSDIPTGMNYPYHSLFKIKINSNGNILWSKTYIDSLFYNDYWFKKTIALNNSYYAAGGTIINLNYNSPTLFTDSTQLGFFAKTDTSGNILWAKKYGNFKTVINDFVLTQDSGFIFVGSHETYDSINGLQTSMIYFKTDSNGNVLWNYKWSVPYAEAKTIIKDGNSFLIGGVKSGSGGGDGFILKIDSSGNILWSKNYGGAGYDEITSLVILNNHKYAFSRGTSDINIMDNDGNNAVYHGVSNISGYQIKQLMQETDGGLSSFGLKIFKTSFFKTDSNFYTCTNYIALNQTSNLTILRDTFEIPLSSIQIFLINDSFTTQSITISDSTFCQTLTGDFENNISKKEPKIYPNPCNNNLTFEMSNRVRSDYNLLIKDLTGRIILSSIETAQKIIVDTHQLNSGIYLLSVKSMDESWTKKFIKL